MGPQEDVAADVAAGTPLDAAWRDHGPAMLRYATVLVGVDDAPDVTSTAFMRATGSQSWVAVIDPRRYLIRAVHNEAANHRRQLDRRRRRDEAAALPVADPPHEPAVDLVRAIRKLTVRQRSLIYLTYWEDLSEPAIAELLEMSTGTVHHHLARARERLRKALA